MRVVTIILICLAWRVFGQKPDTLIIDKYKYPLVKTKTYYNEKQKGFPALPSEFVKSTNKNFVLHYKCTNPDVYETHNDSLDNNYTIILGLTRDTAHKCKEGEYIFTNILDTLYMEDLSRTEITPSLWIDRKEYSLCSAKLLELRNDTVTQCTFGSNFGPLSISFSFSRSYTTTDNKAIYILTDLYYRKGKTTYYLDKEFLVRIKKH